MAGGQSQITWQILKNSIVNAVSICVVSYLFSGKRSYLSIKGRFMVAAEYSVLSIQKGASSQAITDGAQ